SEVEPRPTAKAGFTLVELMISMAMIGVMLGLAVRFFASQNKAYVQQDLVSSLDENLRYGMAAITDPLRSAGYGVPTASLSSWIPWVTGFTENPLISGSGPQAISIASCFQDVGTLTSRAASGATTLLLTSSVSGKALTDLLDTSSRRLILIDGSLNAQV